MDSVPDARIIQHPTLAVPAAVEVSMPRPIARPKGPGCRTRAFSLVAFAAALGLVCGSGTARANPKDWPAFWRGRFDAQTVAG
jgi:hypothetical protein